MDVATWQDAGVTIGARIKAARLTKRLKGIDLAPLVGVDSATVSHWEHDKRVPGGKNSTKLAKALGVSEAWLMTGEGPRDAVVAATTRPIGLSALDDVLSEFEWPDVPIDVVDEIERALREEARTTAGQGRSASAWRLRVRQLLRERESGRHRRREA